MRRLQRAFLGMAVVVLAGAACNQIGGIEPGLALECTTDADVPDDGDACTLERCIEGVRTHVPQSEGAGCSCGGSGSPAVNPSVLDDNCGVFVAPSGSDEGGAGTKASPYKTLGRAVEAAGAKGASRVFACSGTYPESVVIPGGLELYGSLACPDGVWAAGAEKSVIAGLPDTIAARLGGEGAIVLEGFAIVAADATMAGGSSIAVLAEPKSQVEIRGCDFTSASAGDGEKGNDGPSTPPVTPMTDDTNKGRPACPKPPDDTATNPGGIEHVNTCGGTEDESIGGPGGTGFVNQAGDGAPGIAMPPPENPTGAGGIAAAECATGGDGGSGAAGADGAPGLPGQGNGSLSVVAGFRGVPGGDGTKGKAGQGGGGGGGQKGTVSGCAGMSGAGASGGSGGAGGCGGGGGSGGKAGGSSIALVSIDASVTLVDVKLQSGKGGMGGVGGSAQVGGLGAAGALGGGNNGNVALKVGCKGGDGGPGGKGGPGAGGSGGHSLAIAYYGTAPTGTFDAALGAPGLGGDGGGGSSVNEGAPGQATDVLELDAFDPS